MVTKFFTNLLHVYLYCEQLQRIAIARAVLKICAHISCG